MKRCCWVSTYVEIDDEIYYVDRPYFYYGNNKDLVIEFKTFEDLYYFAETRNDKFLLAKKNLFGKKYISLVPWDCFERVYHFKKAKYVKEYREFQPTMREAFENLTVQQFMEYVGANKNECKEVFSCS